MVLFSVHFEANIIKFKVHIYSILSAYFTILEHKCMHIWGGGCIPILYLLLTHVFKVPKAYYNDSAYQNI